MRQNARQPSLRGGRRPGLLLLAFALALVLAPAAHAAKIDAEKAAGIKAACLYHLSGLVRWAETRIPEPASPILIGVVGKDPYGIAGYLESRLRQLGSEDRPVAVKRFPLLEATDPDRTGTAPDSAELRQCHIVLFTVAGEELFEGVRDTLAEVGAVTVGETEPFVKAGGMVSFTVRRGRVRILANLKAVEKAGVKISAEFLQHAKIVKPRREAR